MRRRSRPDSSVGQGSQATPRRAARPAPRHPHPRGRCTRPRSRPRPPRPARREMGVRPAERPPPAGGEHPGSERVPPAGDEAAAVEDRDPRPEASGRPAPRRLRPARSRGPAAARASRGATTAPEWPSRPGKTPANSPRRARSAMASPGRGVQEDPLQLAQTRSGAPCGRSRLHSASSAHRAGSPAAPAHHPQRPQGRLEAGRVCRPKAARVGPPDRRGGRRAPP